MANWDKATVACKITWITLSDLDQHSRGFDNAGKLKMKNLGFWDPNASKPVLKMRAKTVQIQCDNLFRRYYGAKYEDNKTRPQVQRACLKVLTDPDKTVADLAEVNDSVYEFFGE
ncbi:MAG: hypothetical protein NXI31_26955 [bacterium]|nr:hypothetical protein [bacterium]